LEWIAISAQRGLPSASVVEQDARIHDQVDIGGLQPGLIQGDGRGLLDHGRVVLGLLAGHRIDRVVRILDPQHLLHDPAQAGNPLHDLRRGLGQMAQDVLDPVERHRFAG
jgi:hypothetical protein